MPELTDTPSFGHRIARRTLMIIGASAIGYTVLFGPFLCLNVALSFRLVESQIAKDLLLRPHMELAYHSGGYYSYMMWWAHLGGSTVPTAHWAYKANWKRYQAIREGTYDCLGGTGYSQQEDGEGR